VDKKLWDKAADIYRNGKITEFEEFYAGYTALVLGSEPYDTAVSNTNFNQGNCNCFWGNRGFCANTSLLWQFLPSKTPPTLDFKNK